ncbi:MAG: hypothetical protein WC436_00460 [Candidatus Babeliales bacterium]
MKHLRVTKFLKNILLTFLLLASLDLTQNFAMESDPNEENLIPLTIQCCDNIKIQIPRHLAKQFIDLDLDNLLDDYCEIENTIYIYSDSNTVNILLSLMEMAYQNITQISNNFVIEQLSLKIQQFNFDQIVNLIKISNFLCITLIQNACAHTMALFCINENQYKINVLNFLNIDVKSFNITLAKAKNDKILDLFNKLNLERSNSKFDLSKFNLLFYMAIAQILKVESLDLCMNNLAKIPTSISNLTNLTCLNLSCNFLTTLPAEILHLTHLRKLFLSGNRNLNPEKVLPFIDKLRQNGCEV